MLSMLVLAAALAAGPTSCESLRSLSWPDTMILSAPIVPAGPFTPPSAARAPQPSRQITVPAACRVVGRIAPAVNFEVWMPASNWNGKFQGVGGGGFAGVISYGPMAGALLNGYATASTDTRACGSAHAPTASRSSTTVYAVWMPPSSPSG